MTGGSGSFAATGARSWRSRFPRGGEFLASAAQDVIIWDPAGGRELFRLPQHDRKPVKLLAFAGSGATLISVGETGHISEWDLRNRSLLREVQDPDKAVHSAAANFAATHFVLGTEFSALQKGITTFSAPGTPIRPTDLYRQNRLKIYEVASVSMAKKLDGIDGQARSLAVSSDSHYLALARQRAKESYLSVFSVGRGIEVASLPVSGTARAVAFSPDGRWLGAAADDGSVLLLAVTGVQRSGDMGDLVGVKFVVIGPRQPLIPSETSLVVAVMDFDALNVDVAEARAVSDYLRNRIAGTSGVQLVTRTRMEQILKEQNFQYSTRADPQAAVSIGRILNARKMILGSVSRLGTSVTIHAEMIDVETARIDGTREVLCQRCSPEDLPLAVAELKPTLVAEAR